MHSTIRILAGIFVLTAFAIGVPRAHAATLETLPVQAPAGAGVVARGERYLPGQDVTLRLVASESRINELLGVFPADDAGRLFAQYNIPEVPVGLYSVQARDALGNLLATAAQEVTPSPALLMDPITGPPGTVVGVQFGPVPPGSVEVRYDGVKILGPVIHGGGDFHGSFLVPAAFPDPLGQPVEVQAISRSGDQITSVASEVFETQVADTTEFQMLSAEVPEGELRGGQSIQVSGQMAFPATLRSSDIELTLVWITASGTMIPINNQPIQLDQDGAFVVDATVPSLASGSPLTDIGETANLGMVYKVPGFASGLINIAPVNYKFFDNQPIHFFVGKDPSEQPLAGAVVRVSHNAVLLPTDFSFEPEEGSTTGSASLTANVSTETGTLATIIKSAGSVLHHGPNQFLDAWNQVLPQPVSVTGCEITLSNGQTDSNGEFVLNTRPILNFLYDNVIQSLAQVDINNTYVTVGPAEFSVNINALHLDHGLPNANGACSGQRFDFQFHAEGFDGQGGVDGEWRLRDSLEGDFTIAFDPDAGPLEVLLPEIEPSDCMFTTPTQPYMPDLVTKELVQFDPNTNSILPIRQFGAVWSFPDANGAAFNMIKPPQVRLPHAGDTFGALANVELYFGDELQGAMVPDGMTCSEAGIEYVIDLPQLTAMPPQIVEARITGTMLGQSFERPLKIEIKQGPTWINNAEDFQSRTINWSPELITLVAEEHDRAQDASVSNVPKGVGDMRNNNVSAGTVRQVLQSTGASSRERIGAADAEVSNQVTDGAGETTKPSGSSFVSIGSPNPVTVLDTGRIPLFRWAWGIWPIASATVGADIWFAAQYLYDGIIQHTDSQVLMDLTTAAIASAGLDAWINVSAILDLVSVTGFALPQFDLGMPIVIKANKLDESESEPCFSFTLDMAYAVKVGWCPFCVKADGIEPLISKQTGNCSILSTQAELAVAAEIPEPPATDRTSIAVDGLGEAMAVWGDETGNINIQHFLNGVPSSLILMPAGPGAMAPDAAYLDANRRVLVWAQSSLSEEQFLSHQGNPAAVTPFQHLVYRVFDGSDWSDTMPLTAPTTGDGGVVLAACPDSDPACPPGGEVLAVWVHDVAGDIGQHDLRLRYAFFDGFNWTVPQDVDPTSTVKDLQPTATYLDGDPVVVWVRNPGVIRGGFSADLDLMQRRLAYRFLRQSAGVEEPPELPLGVAWPSVSGFGDNSLVLVYSVATEPDAFLGTRQSLHSAFGTQCFQGECNWSDTERTDKPGRRLFVESPRLSTNNSGQAIVTFRHLGTDNPLPGDPTGVLKHTGTLAQLIFDLAPEVNVATDPIPLTFDDTINWNLDAVYDPATNQVLSTAVQFQAPSASLSLAGQDVKVQSTSALNGQEGTLKSTAPAPATSHSLMGTNSSILLAQRTMLPDFEVVSVNAPATWIPEGETIDIKVSVRNNGPAPNPAQAPMMAAYWDGPPGLGLSAGQQPIENLGTGMQQDVVLTLALPDGFKEDDVHELHLVVNPFGVIDEADGSNNEQTISLGELPVPQNLRAVAESDDRIIVIHWDAVDDPRVTGYRVYRTNPDGSTLSVGSTFVAGFADFSAYSDQPYEYFVASHSARLMESEPSHAVAAITFGESIFNDGFEN